MRICLVISSLQCGGAERVMSLLANWLADKGHVVTVIVFENAAFNPHFNLDARVVIRCADLFGDSQTFIDTIKNSLKRNSVLRRHIRDAAPDVVLSFLDTTNVRVLIATIGLEVPVLISERTNPKMYKLPLSWRLLRRITYPWAEALVLQTERVKEAFPWCKSKIEVIPNPVLQTHRRADRIGTATRVITIARLDAIKRHDFLINAFAKVVRAHGNWSLTIYGDGPERQQLEALIQQRGLRDNVFLPGKTDDVYGVLSQASIFVLSSRFEGFPNALCEAMATGLAVISTDCPYGPREIIRNEIDGLLVPNDDNDALAEALARLMADAALRERLAGRAPEVQQRFGIDRVMSRWNDLFREVAGKV